MKFTLLIYVVFLLLATISASVELLSRTPEIRRFQQYVQIDTETGKSLRPAVSFWKRLAAFAQVRITVREYVANYPVVILKWPGKNSSIPSLVLQTPMDVIAADVRDGWTYPPFSAHIDEKGNLYGRGSQVKKSTSMQHYEALLRLKKIGGPIDIYMVLTPDEEGGDKNGLVPFLKSKDFKEMNAGLFLGIGLPSEQNEILVLYRGKTRWSFQIDCYGPSGYTAEIVNSTTSADGQCGRFYEFYTEYRNQQTKLYESNGNDISKVTVINFAGPQAKTNVGVVPKCIFMYFDAYLAVDTSLCDFQDMVNDWITQSGENILLKTIVLDEAGKEVVTGDKNPYWTALQEASKKVNIPFNAGTNHGPGSGYVADAGYPVFGLSPLNNTTNLIHAINERIDILTYYNGINIYEEIFKAIYSIPANKVSKDPSDYLE